MPTEGLKTRFAGTVDFVPAEPLSSPELSERLADLAADEAVAESGIGSRGDFPGPLFIAVPPIEIEWEQRRQVAAASGANANVSYTDLIRTAAAGKFTPFHERFMFGSVANHLADKYGTKGSPISLSTACASGATAIQLGVEAIRRGETSAALCIGSDGSINPELLIRFSLLSALSTSSDPPEQAAKPFAKNRDGFVMAEGAGALVLESLESATARGAKILGVIERLRRDGRRLPPHALEPGRQADHRLHPQCAGRRRPHARRHRLRQSARHRHARERQDGGDGRHGRVRRAGQNPADVVQQVDGRPHAVGRGRGRGGVLAADACSISASRRPSTIRCRIPAIPMDVVPNEARDAKVRHVISNSFGFGGQNVSLVMGREPA